MDFSGFLGQKQQFWQVPLVNFFFQKKKSKNYFLLKNDSDTSENIWKWKIRPKTHFENHFRQNTEFSHCAEYTEKHSVDRMHTGNVFNGKAALTLHSRNSKRALRSFLTKHLFTMINTKRLQNKCLIFIVNATRQNRVVKILSQ